jgi:bacterioferritin
MLSASADHVILGYLGRALSLEFSAVQLYSTQARLVASWGLAEPASKLRSEASEEMEHVDRIIGRMLALNVAPNASQLRPAFVGKSLVELLQFDLTFELELVKLYHDATTYCAKIGDHDSRLFFETLLKEEQAHSHELSQWIAQLEQPVSSQGATF